MFGFVFCIKNEQYLCGVSETDTKTILTTYNILSGRFDLYIDDKLSPFQIMCFFSGICLVIVRVAPKIIHAELRIFKRFPWSSDGIERLTPPKPHVQPTTCQSLLIPIRFSNANNLLIN